MTSFDQSKHPRTRAGTSKGGQFAVKEHSAPEAGLNASQLDAAGEDVTSLRDGVLHSFNGPALVQADSGLAQWYHDGELLHTEPRPRITDDFDRHYTREDGALVWYKGAEMYVERTDGAREWFQRGAYHRESGPARIEPDGTLEYRRDGGLHRTIGPARIVADGRQEWWRHGVRHRTDGPAAIDTNGFEYWYTDGVFQFWVDRDGHRHERNTA